MTELQNLDNYATMDSTMKDLKADTDFMFDNNPCHYKTETAAFNFTGIAGSSGSNPGANQELFFYSGFDKKVLTNLCNANI